MSAEATKTMLSSGWGRFPRVYQNRVVAGRHSPLMPWVDGHGGWVLPTGNARSYGDSALNANGVAIDCRGLDRILSYDSEVGIIRAEAGVMLHQLSAMILQDGWFLPVTPGTQFVTLGGAVANDVHGKNHHSAGTFGCHVRSFELHRSDGSVRICSPTENSDLFAATIAGMGLTGLILWVELQLAPVRGAMIAEETIRFSSLEEFFSLADESAANFEHTVAWMDSLSARTQLGRGIFMRGAYCADDQLVKRSRCSGGQNGKTINVPFTPPFSALNRWSLKAFNTFYFHRHPKEARKQIVPLEKFFYPLDAITNWNRSYGPRGLLQHQCVVPKDVAPDVFRELLARSQTYKLGSFLTVAKTFGDKRSPGLMSFPRPGATLTLDFPNVGPRLYALLDELDQVVTDAGGAINPYKDARMSPATFAASFPQMEKFSNYIDPRFSSSLWRRVHDVRDDSYRAYSVSIGQAFASQRAVKSRKMAV